PAARVLERVKFLKGVALFSFMSDEQLQGVARIMTERWEADGTYLCHQGDEGNDMYIIVEGQVEIIDESGREDQVILTEQAGACIGELAALEIIPRVAAMRTKGEVRLLVLQGSHFRSLIHENPDMSQRVIQMLVRKLADATLAEEPVSEPAGAEQPVAEHPGGEKRAK
ncbi:MAG: cyclic nucleotide-binding domain-containing protein, partial [Chloroflexi bacterium]|nr:cyclic nucleotide-binding domain-containing protein [Chloroflexota bacterium]